MTYDPNAHEVDAQNTRDRVVVDRKTWSPAQIVAGGIGLFLTVLGAVAALRIGFDFTASASVLGLTHTLLMALIHIVVGIIFLSAAGNALGSRGTMTTLGLVLIAFGLVYGIEGDSLAGALGGDERMGWIYAIVGAVSLLTAWLSPTIHVRREASARRVDTVHDSSTDAPL
ncbi:MAG TPA: hypothetical protein VHL55_06320 [Acidimicrobiia bacterium]|nr:hypothetical protein [Acidimicrobiia bacterium]